MFWIPQAECYVSVLIKYTCSLFVMLHISLICSHILTDSLIFTLFIPTFHNIAFFHSIFRPQISPIITHDRMSANQTYISYCSNNYIIWIKCYLNKLYTSFRKPYFRVHNTSITQTCTQFKLKLLYISPKYCIYLQLLMKTRSIVIQVYVTYRPDSIDLLFLGFTLIMIIIIYYYYMAGHSLGY